MRQELIFEIFINILNDRGESMDNLPEKTENLINRLAKKKKTTVTRLIAEYFVIFNDPSVQEHPELPNDEARHNYARAMLKSVYEPGLL